MIRSASIPAAVLAAALLTAGGCLPQQPPDTTRQELAAAKDQLREAKRENDALTERLAKQQQQIDTLMGLADKRLDNLALVTAVTLGSNTGGVNTDNRPGDDAVKAYVTPMDADGSIIKAVGDVKIQLFDLAAPEGETLLGEYTWPAAEMRKHWASGFLAYHFSFVCPWKNGAPAHDKITVRLEFVDYFSGKTFTDQKLCTIQLPPAATQPGK